MTNLDHLYGPSGVIHRVNHAIVALPDPEPTLRNPQAFHNHEAEVLLQAPQF